MTVVRYTPQAVLDRQRRGGALPRARLRRRPAARRGALRRAQQPAQLSQGDDAGGFDRVERGGRRASDSAGRGGERTRSCCRSKRDAPATRRRPSSSSSCTCSGSTRGPTRDGRASICRRSICRCREPASSCTTRRAFASSRSRASFRVEQRSRSSSRRRCAGRRRPPSSRQAAQGEARAASGLQALVDRFRNEPGGRTVVGSLPVHVTFPAFGPSVFLASELTAEGSAPSVELAFKRTRN